MSRMKTFRDSAVTPKTDYTVKFFITELILCTVLLGVCFAMMKLLPDMFAYIKTEFLARTKDGYTLPEIGSFLSKAAKDVMEYIGVSQQN